MWTKGFDPYAKVWCRHCGEGDSLRGVRVIDREEFFSIEAIDFPESAGYDRVEEDVKGVTYHCDACNAESDSIETMATESQNEAHEIFKEKHPNGLKPKEVIFIEDEDYYGDDGYYNGDD